MQLLWLQSDLGVWRQLLWLQSDRVLWRQLLWLRSDLGLWRLLLLPLSLLCSKLDHLVLLGRPPLHSQKDLFLRLHLHRFARIQLVLELLLPL